MYIEALVNEVEQKARATRRIAAAQMFTIDDYLMMRANRFPKAAKKRRIWNKWRNDLIRRGVWDRLQMTLWVATGEEP
jgi:hypothetical protein